MAANALTVVHKFIRHELFDMSRTLSSAGPEECDTVLGQLDRLVELLEEHARHEESGFEPLIRKHAPEAADRLMQDHKSLHAELDQVHAGVRALDASDESACAIALLQLHLDWNRFLGRYLLHLDDEERTLFTVISNEIPPIEVMAEGAAEHDPENAEAFLDKLVTLIAPDEREAIERGRRVSAL
jgi:hypothetical protein